VPALHTSPLAQARSVVPAVEQPPQLALSLFRSWHLPSLHQVVPAEHVTTQAPPLQSCPAGHVFPQNPQLKRSLVVSVQVAAVAGPPSAPPPHIVRPVPQVSWQTPPVHTRPRAHTWPHIPQFALSVSVSTQRPLHKAEPLGQLVWQVPATQTLPTAQASPQPPQLARSESVETQKPEQIVWVAGQVRLPESPPKAEASPPGVGLPPEQPLTT